MKLDIRKFTIDEEFGDLLIDKKVEYIIDIELYIDAYIKLYEIKPICVAVTSNAAKIGCSCSTVNNTLRNLQVLFEIYYDES